MENNEIKERKVLVYKDNGDKKVRFSITTDKFSDVMDIIKREFGMSDNDVKNYEFIDGMHRTRYSENSILPESSVHPRTGQRTTDLSIFMVRAKKNIESGSKPICTFAKVDKKAIGQEIKLNNLNKAVVEYCGGLNLTQARGEDMLVILAANIGIENVKSQYQIIDNPVFKEKVDLLKAKIGNKRIPSNAGNNTNAYNKGDEEKGKKEIEQPEHKHQEKTDKKPCEIKGESKNDNANDEGTGGIEESGKSECKDRITEESIIEYFKSLNDEDALELINRINNEKFGHIITDSDMMEMMAHL